MLPATLAPNRSSWSIRGNICATNHNRAARGTPSDERQVELDFVDVDASSPSPTARDGTPLDGRSIPIPATSGQ